jgi:CheY-like chemotaxis protein
LLPAEKISISPGQKVLIADDMQLNHYLMGELLKNCGFVPIYAQNGQQALQLARDELFAIILLDIYMPVMDGLQCAKQIRRLPNPNSTIPIVAITANKFESDESVFKQAGISATLAKPISQEQIEHLLLKFFGSGPATQSASLTTANPVCQKGTQLDLTYLKKISREDPVLLVKILDSFCTTTERLVKELAPAILQQDTVATKNLIHQLKFPMSVVGQTELVNQLDKLEKGSQNSDFAYLKSLLPLVQSLVTEAREYLIKMAI